MEKKLAIKGHPTRGNEVIELFKMMGGWECGYCGCGTGFYYYISQFGNIEASCKPTEFDTYIVYTLEEFLEKFPYKVGDKVYIYIQNDDIDGRYDIEVAEITSMRWNPARCKIAYKMKDINREFYKEEIKCKVDDSDDVHSISECKTIGQGTYAIRIADGYKFDSIDENGNIIIKSIKPKYPTTYDECCDMLNADEFVGYELMTNFPKLINARNAYWKIAGEQMGLGKPWEPEYDCNDTKYIISTSRNTIYKDISVIFNYILIFPTEEMRDAFFENFKDLIEQCKELL